MNEQILKLAQATDMWCDQNYSGDEFYHLRWEEKFAELIVKECVSKCKTDWYGDSLDDICVQMLNYFGVEE